MTDTVTVDQYRNLVAADMPENQLQDEVETIARGLGYLVYHTWNSQHSAAGFPDLMMVNPVSRRLVYAELKSATGKLRPEQAAWLDALDQVAQHINRHLHVDCVLVCIWRPSDLVAGRIHEALE